jgi:hypothetical protein
MLESMWVRFCVAEKGVVDEVRRGNRTAATEQVHKQVELGNESVRESLQAEL